MPPHGGSFNGAMHSHDAEFPDDDWNLYAMIDKSKINISLIMLSVNNTVIKIIFNDTK